MHTVRRTWLTVFLTALLLVGTGAEAQSVVEEAALTASDAGYGDWFGRSISISGDIVVIGASEDDHAGEFSGSAYVFRGPDSWVEEAKLTASDAQAGEYFGREVAASGNVVVVGANQSGAAYVFEYDGADWLQMAKIAGSDVAHDDHFGISLDIDGSRIIVGAPLGGASNKGAAYVFEKISGAWVETRKLMPPSLVDGDLFGYSVAIEGDRVAVGASGDDIAGPNAGAVYVFDLDTDSGIWMETAKMTAGDGASSLLGQVGLAISGDRVLAGTPWGTHGGIETGAVYAFELKEGTWQETAKLVASDRAVDDRFGFSVALDGTRAFVGTTGDDAGATDAGSAYLFEIRHGHWTQVAKLTDPNPAPTGFGWAVGLDGDYAAVGHGMTYVYRLLPPPESQFGEVKVTASDAADYDTYGNAVDVDGNWAIVAAELDDDNGNASGSVFILEREGSGWNETNKLTASDASAGARFGRSVSLRGSRALIGAFEESGRQGAAYVLDEDGGNWTESAKLTASDGGTNDWFGWVVSVSGGRALVGAPTTAAGGDAGAVYVYEFDGSAWSQTAKLQATDSCADEWFGFDVALDDNRALISDRYDDDGGYRSGAVYVFEYDGTAWVQIAKLRASDPDEWDTFGYAVSLEGDVAVVGAHGNDDAGNQSGAAYVFEYNGTTWVQTAKLTAGDAQAGDAFGSPVAIGGGRILIGASQEDEIGLDAGAAYLFERVAGVWTETTKITPIDGQQTAIFGVDVALSQRFAIVGARGDSEKGLEAGAAYLYTLQPAASMAVPDLQVLHNQAFTVPITLSESAGVVSVELFLAYDPTVLAFEGVSSAGTLVEGWSVESNEELTGGGLSRVLLAMATDESSASGPATLVELSFTTLDVREPANSPLNIAHALLNDGDPEVDTVDGSVTITGVDASLSTDVSQVQARSPIAITVVDVDEDRDQLVVDEVTVYITNGSDAETARLTETDVSTGEFAGSIGTVFSTSASAGDGEIQAKAGDVIQLTYTDLLDASGTTTPRQTQVTVLGGTDGALAISQVSQPGDKVYVRVTDADLNADPGIAETASVVATSPSGESEAITVTEVDVDTDVFFGSVLTAPGAAPGTDDDGTLVTFKGDILTATYHDDLTEIGGEADLGQTHQVIDPFGDADGNGLVQAFDAAQALLHVLTSHLAGLELLAANVDELAPLGSGVDPYDAALILQKRVGLIGIFPVQEPTSANHPQPETAANPKPVPASRVLSLVPGEGYLALWADDREGIVAGDVTLSGVEGQAVLSPEMRGFLTEQCQDGDALRVVFAGASALAGPGELLRMIPMDVEEVVRIDAAELNGGRLRAVLMEGATNLVLPSGLALHPNHPNPFNPETSIRFDLPTAARVELQVYDVLGRQVQVLESGNLPPGAHRRTWDGRDDAGRQVAGGVYILRLRAQSEVGSFERVRRMLLVK